MTIEEARPPRTIWSIRVFKVSVKIDPKHPHLLVEWPARSQKLWRFRVGYRWDANAKAYIFPALALKKVDGPMQEYQRDKTEPHLQKLREVERATRIDEPVSEGRRYIDQ